MRGLTTTLTLAGSLGPQEDTVASGSFEVHPVGPLHNDDCPIRWSYGPCPGCDDWTVYVCAHIPLTLVDEAIVEHAENECPELAVVIAGWLLEHPRNPRNLPPIPPPPGDHHAEA